MMIASLFVNLFFLSHAAFAETGAQYFNGVEFEELKPVQMIGVTKAGKDLERENQIGRVVETNSRKLSYCYEKELNNGPLNHVDAIFYFSVGADGKFSGVTADVISVEELTSSSQHLISCASQMLNSFRAPAFSADRTFRFRVSFSQQ